MKYRVIYAPRTERNLGKIREWITAESRNPIVADRFIRDLFGACEKLETFPERFPLYPFAKRWRMMPFGNYLIFSKFTSRKCVSAMSGTVPESHFAPNAISCAKLILN